MAAVALKLVELPAHVKEGFAQLGELARANPGQAVPIPKELMLEWRKATAHLDGELNAQLMEIRRKERRGWAAAAEALQSVAFGAAGAVAGQVVDQVADAALEACAGAAVDAAGCAVSVLM